MSNEPTVPPADAPIDAPATTQQERSGIPYSVGEAEGAIYQLTDEYHRHLYGWVIEQHKALREIAEEVMRLHKSEVGEIENYGERKKAAWRRLDEYLRLDK